jgi:Gamma-glutamyl cyclotransferase, AIG2-like
MDRTGTRSAFFYGKSHSSPHPHSCELRIDRYVLTGTLMAPQVFYKVLYGSENPTPRQERKTTVRPAILHKFRRQRVRGAPFPAITPHPSANVRGAYVTGLTDDDITQLDHFEGLGVLYDRKKVRVKLLKKSVGVRDDIADAGLESLENGEVDTETYVWSEHGMELEDEEWDFEDFRKKKMRGWMGQPETVLDYDGEVDDGFAAADAARVERARAGGAGRGRGTSAGRRSDARDAGEGQSRGSHRSTSVGLGASANRNGSESRGRGAGLSSSTAPTSAGRGASSDRGASEGRGAGRGREASTGRGAIHVQLPSRSQGASDERGVSKGRGVSGGQDVTRQISKELKAIEVDLEAMRRRVHEGRGTKGERSKEFKGLQAGLDNVRRRDKEGEKVDQVKAIQVELEKIRRGGDW